jgi:hypothetical protein
MAYEHNAVIQAQYHQLEAERARALAEYEAGRVNEDEFSTMSAADRILEIDQKRTALDRIAQNFVAARQQPQGNQYGLNEDEIAVAHGIASNDPRMSKDDRERLYAEKRQQLRAMRANGSYRDDPGRVSR